MSRTKNSFIAAGALIGLGATIFGVTFLAAGCDFGKFSTVKYSTQTHEVKESFQSIAVEVSTSDVFFAVAEDNQTKVVCYEEEKIPHRVSVADGVLTVTAEDTRAWYDYAVIGTDNASVTVYLPQATYEALTVVGSTGDVGIAKELAFEGMNVDLSTGDVRVSAAVAGLAKIEVSTGDITVEDTSVGSLDLTVSTGEIILSSVASAGEVKLASRTGDTSLKNVTCAGLTSAGTTGDIELKNVLISGKMSIERSSGDVEFERCDAAEIYVKTSTGEVEGSLLTGKTFYGESSTGKRRLPQTTGGKCEIYTSTGDVEITIVNG